MPFVASSPFHKPCSAVGLGKVTRIGVASALPATAMLRPVLRQLFPACSGLVVRRRARAAARLRAAGSSAAMSRHSSGTCRRRGPAGVFLGARQRLPGASTPGTVAVAQGGAMAVAGHVLEAIIHGTAALQKMAGETGHLPR